MLRVGIIGIGFMGWIHWLAYKQNSGIEVVAVSDVETQKLTGDWTSIKGNFGPAGERVDLSTISTYETADELIADPTIDLVDICLPPALHAELTIKALAAGKHVFCEKPMSLTSTGCNSMLAAADEAGRQLLIGHVLPFFPEYAAAREIVASGKYGPLLGGHFKRVISDPKWIKGFYDSKKVGGPLIDLHVHDAHFIRTLFGMPKHVSSVGRRRGSVVQYCATTYDFPDQNFAVSSVMGVLDQQGRAFTHGFEIHLEQATLHFEFADFADQAELAGFKILAADGKVIRQDLGDGDPVSAFVAEIGEVVHSLKTDRLSALLDGKLARDAIEICIMQDQAVKGAVKGPTL